MSDKRRGGGATRIQCAHVLFSALLVITFLGMDLFMASGAVSPCVVDWRGPPHPGFQSWRQHRNHPMPPCAFHGNIKLPSACSLTEHLLPLLEPASSVQSTDRGGHSCPYSCKVSMPHLVPRSTSYHDRAPRLADTGSAGCGQVCMHVREMPRKYGIVVMCRNCQKLWVPWGGCGHLHCSPGLRGCATPTIVYCAPCVRP